MKKLLIIILATLLIGGCIPWDIYRDMVQAADLQRASDEAVMETDCLFTMTYRICTAQVQGEQLYLVSNVECSQVGPWTYTSNSSTIERARQTRDNLNNYCYYSCVNQKKQDAMDKALKSAIWKEVK